MNISKNEAQMALEIADDAIRSLKRAVERQASRLIMVWGVVYVLAPLAMHLWPRWGIIPLQLLLIGAIGYTIYDTNCKSLVSGDNNWRIGCLWGITFAFGSVWFFILSSSSYQYLVTTGDYQNIEVNRHAVILSQQM